MLTNWLYNYIINKQFKMNNNKIQNVLFAGRLIRRCCNEYNDNWVIPLRVLMIGNPDKILKILSELHDNK